MAGRIALEDCQIEKSPVVPFKSVFERLPASLRSRLIESGSESRAG